MEFLRVVLLLFMLGHVSIDSPSDGLPNPPHFLASVSPFLAIRPRYSSEYRMFLPVHIKIAFPFFLYFLFQPNTNLVFVSHIMQRKPYQYSNTITKIMKPEIRKNEFKTILISHRTISYV